MGSLTTAEICTRVLDQDTLPTTLHGRETAVKEHQEARQTTTNEKWLEAPDKFRTETLTVDEWDNIETELDALNPFERMDSSKEGSFYVQNATEALVYDDAENTSKIYEFESAEGVSVMTSTLVETVVGDTFEVSTAGTAVVADHECYELVSTPTDSADSLSGLIDTYRLWVDQEYGYPLKQEYTYEIQEGTVVVNEQFEEVEFDGEIQADVFDCMPPDGSTVIE